MLISDEYRKLNTELHNKNIKYGISGKRHAYLVERYINDKENETILDYGCGKGTLGNSLKEYKIYEYDPCIPEKSNLPYPADFVFCGDVLEHIERNCLDYVLYHIIALTKKTVIFVIALKQGKRKLSDGSFAHKIVKNSKWWKNKLDYMFYGFNLIYTKECEKELILVYTKNEYNK